MKERELIALEDLCATLHKEVADLEKERRELQEQVADLEREGRELQEELDRRDEADADIGAALVELYNALGDRVAITFWPMRLRLTPMARPSSSAFHGAGLTVDIAFARKRRNHILRRTARHFKEEEVLVETQHPPGRAPHREEGAFVQRGKARI